MTTRNTDDQLLERIPFILLFASTKDGLIGRNNTIPWECPEDLQHFKNITSDPEAVLLMGRKTWESLPIGKYSGEKLVGRKKFVLTHKKDVLPLKDTVFTDRTSKTDLLKLVRPMGFKRVYIIGGAQLIRNFQGEAEEAIITWIDKKIPAGFGDATWFPGDITYFFDPTGQNIRLSPHAVVSYYRKRD